MKQKMPSTPFSTRLSGSAKETELRLRSIFQWKKKRPPVILFILTVVALFACFGLVSCEPAKAPEQEELPTEGSVSEENMDPVRTSEILSAEYDFNHDGTPEIAELVTVLNPETTQVDWYEFQIKTADGTLLWSEELYTAHVGWNSLFACTLDGEDYLLRYQPAMFQGIGSYSYDLFSLNTENGAAEIIRQSDDVEFHVNFGSSAATGFDGHDVADFMDEINELLAHSKLLFTTDLALENIDPARPYHDPSWLHSDASFWGFTYDETRSMRENILLFGECINAASQLKYYETHTLRTEGGHLTLVLEGTQVENRDNYYRLNQLRLYDGTRLLQTIEPDAIVYEGDHLFEGLFVLDGGSAFGDPDFRDINFDGSDDVGFLCAAAFPKNVPYTYFLWDEDTEQLVFTCVLFTPVELDEENHRLIEEIVGSPAGTYHQYNTYEFDAEGQLTLVDSEVVYTT